MGKITVTQQQRDNAIEALEVMWPSVPPENVIEGLNFWRKYSGRDVEPVSCGTVACFGGWCAAYPKFSAQGIDFDTEGMPWKGRAHGCDVATYLFGEWRMFARRGVCDVDEGFTGTDHELVTHRLNWLIENIEVV
jgi:hypothetical protein